MIITDSTKNFLNVTKWFSSIGIIMAIIKACMVLRPKVNKTFSIITIIMLVIAIIVNIFGFIWITLSLEGRSDFLYNFVGFMTTTLSLIVSLLQQFEWDQEKHILQVQKSQAMEEVMVKMKEGKNKEAFKKHEGISRSYLAL